MGDRVDWRGGRGASVMRGMTRDMRRIREMETYYVYEREQNIVRPTLTTSEMILDFQDDEDDDWDEDDDPIGHP